MIRSQHLVQRSVRRAAQACNVVARNQFWSPASFFSAPKGFERYFRKPESSSKDGKSSSSKESGDSKQSSQGNSEQSQKSSDKGSNSTKNDSSKGKGGKKMPDNFDPDKNIKKLLIATSVMTLLSLGVFEDSQYGR